MSEALPIQDAYIDGRYLLRETLGAGGEAHVYRARDTVTGYDVAVRLALNPTTYAAPTTVPAHANWVQFYHWGNDPQWGAYQVYELLEGSTLDLLIGRTPLNADSWRLFVGQSLDAVAALHDSGWVHGDLNAGNFFLTSIGWKLLELPFLRFDPPPNRTALFGSIFTLAPEQIDGMQPNFQSDLYSLGCLCYYAACGQFPHTGSTTQEIAINRLCFAPPPLAEKATLLPAEWSAWVMLLLARSAQERPASVAAARQLLGVA
jgi:serine/threonine-protein kinase